MSNYAIGIALALLAAFSWSIASIFYSKALSNVTDPILTNILRIPLALIFLITVSILMGKLSLLYNILNLNLLLIIIFATFIMNVIGDTAYLLSIRNIGVSIAYPLSYSYPILVAIIAFLVLGEEIYLSLILGTLIALIGIWFLFRDRNKNEVGGRKIIGFISGIGASLSWSIGIVIFKISILSSSPITVAILKLIILAILISPTIKTNYNTIKSTLTKKALTLAMIGGFFGIGLGDFLFYLSLNNVEASLAAAITTISPLFSLLLAIIYLKEEINLNRATGTILIVSGIILVSSKII